MKYLYTLIIGAILVVGAVVYAGVSKPAQTGSYGAISSGVGRQTCTNTSVTVSSTTSTAILAQNGARAYARITNDGAAPVYFSRGGTAATSTGGTIPAGSYLELSENNEPYWGAINGIASSSANTVKVIECAVSTVY